MKRFWAHGQPLFALCPYSVSASAHRHQSTIEYRGKTRPTWDVKVLRTAQKTSDAVQRALFNRRMIAAWTSAAGGASAATPADEPQSARARLTPHQSA